jgi:TrmH family RNA methyltransferase
MELITSKQNVTVKHIFSLRQTKHRKKHRQFILEGDKAIADAIGYGYKCVYILTSSTLSLAKPAPTYIASQEIIDYLSTSVTPQHAIAVFEYPEVDEGELYDAQKVLYLDRVQNADNMGALIRTAVCAGYDAVIATDDSADFYSDKSVRASAGSVLGIRLYRIKPEVLNQLNLQGFELIGADMAGEEAFDLPTGKFVLIVGNEGSGIREETRSLCHRLVRVKIIGNCESLNAAVAGGILMYKLIG